MEKDNKEKALVEETVTTEVTEPAEGNAEEATPSVSRVKRYWSQKFPDKTYETDEEFDGMLADHLESSDTRMKELEGAEETFRSVAMNHPELLDIVEDLADDPEMTLAEAMYNNLGEDEFLPEEGSPDFERMRKARKNRKAQEAEAEAYRKQLAENLKTSEETIQKYFEENEVSEEEQKAIGDFIDDLLAGLVENRITADTMAAFRRARNYERDMAEAEAVGEIKGKNAKIDAERQRKKEETDGLPAPGSAAGVSVKPPVEKDFLDELIDRGNARSNWYK
jgi:hypothetical protein